MQDGFYFILLIVVETLEKVIFTVMKNLKSLFLCFATTDYPDQGRFSWSLYLEETGAKAVAAEVFKVVRNQFFTDLKTFNRVHQTFSTLLSESTSQLSASDET